MLKFVRQIPSYLRGAGFEDEHDVDEFLALENTTKLQHFLWCVIFGLVVFSIVMIAKEVI